MPYIQFLTKHGSALVIVDQLLLTKLNYAHLLSCLAPMDRSHDLCETVCKLLGRHAIPEFYTWLFVQEMTNASYVDLMHSIAMAQSCWVAILYYFNYSFVILLQFDMNILL